MQLADDFNVSARDVGIASSAQDFVSYQFDEAVTFRPKSTKELLPFGGIDGSSRFVKSDGEMCNTAPDFHITTRCFPYQWHAIAPVTSNGWVLTGEIGKYIPVSRQRISSISIIKTGGFKLTLRGLGEHVSMGAANMNKTGDVVSHSYNQPLTVLPP